MTGWTQRRGRRFGRLCVALACVGAVLSGCAGAGSAQTTPSATTPGVSPAATPTRGEDPTAAPATPVKRPGDQPSTRVGADPADIADQVRYQDGVSVEVTSVTHSTVQAQGPGDLTGDPVTLIAVSVRNGAATPIDVSQVVAELRYDDPARIARPVYTPDTRDLSGTLQPGAQADAVYGFSIPAAALDNVTLTLDLDGGHDLAVLTGSVK